MYTEWRTATKYVIGIALAIIVVYVLYLSRSVIYLLVAGGLIAFLLRPLVRLFNRKLRFPRGLAVVVAHLLGIILLLLAPLILIPPILSAANVLLEIDYQVLINNALQSLENTLINLKESGLQILGVKILLDSLVNPILGYLLGVSPEFQPQLPAYDVIVDSLSSAFTVSFGFAVSFVGSVLSGIVAILFLLLSSVYLSMDGGRFYQGFLNWFPASQRMEMATLSRHIRLIWDAFFRGQLVLMIIIGTTVWLGLTIMGVHGAFALGIIAGLLEIVPTLGPILSAIPAVLVALIQGSSHFDINHLIFALIVISFYALVQAFENYMVVPQVLGEAVQLHPLIVMTGVIAGASIFGLLGALLAAPVIATAKEIAQYMHHKMMDEDPFPPQVVKARGKISWWASFKDLVLRGRSFAESRINLPVSAQPQNKGFDSGSESEGMSSQEDSVEEPSRDS